MAPTASLLLPAPPFVSISDMRRLQFLPRGRRRPLLCWSGAGWGSVRTQMLSSFVGSRRSSRRSVICASLFGVGAPEALVIGVVALLVFGPKGLAEVARNLGKTLRAFQPTIRELQDVSTEFRSTLEREIGIDEVPPSTNYRPTTTNNNEQPASDPNVKPETAPYTSEELMKVTEEQIAASAAAAWNTQPGPSQEQEAAPPTQSTDTATSGGNDGHAAPAPTTESAPSEANQSEKAPSEANQSEKARSEANQSEKARSEANKSEKVESERSKSV